MRAVFTPDIKTGFSYLSSLVGAAAEEHRRAWVLIPDQMALTTERELSVALSASHQLYYDTVSFDRLANNIFRRVGGLSYNYADRGAELLTLWRAMSACRDTLLVYGNSLSDATAVPVMMGAITELKQSMISPEDFMAAAVRLSYKEKDAETGASAADKYIDIANIYAAYDELLTENYDDRLADISSASKLLSENDFFGGGKLIVFSFSSFTHQQYAILREAAKQCSELTVIFTCPTEFHGERDGGVLFDGILDTLRRLRVTADRARRPFTVESVAGTRTDTPYDLASALWSTSAAPIGDGADDVSVFECATAAEEAELAAITIARAVRDGMRYRDIAVVTGSMESYSGIIDRIFDEYGIPYHISQRYKLQSVPVFAAVMSALRVVTGGWRRDDIIAFARTGYGGVTSDEVDELELYMSTWNISGRRFRDPDGGGWGMNPDGYTADWTEDGVAVLATVNEARAAVVRVLSPLHDAFSAKTTAEEKTAAVMDYIASLPIDDADKLGTTAESQVYGILTRALAAITIASPHGTITAEDYMCCLYLVLDTLTVATLPALSDEVDCCDPLRMRGSGYRLVIILGCNDGVLPADVRDTGFFSDADKLLFEGEGISIGASANRASMELYNFSRAISSSYEKLIISYKPEKSGALPQVVGRITTLYPDVMPKKYSGVTDARDIYSRHAMLQHFTTLSSPASSAAVRELLSDDDDGARILSGLDTPISQTYERISDDGARRLFGGDIRLSQSRLESFVLCKFGFYCKYVLSLAEKKRASLTYADVGTFIHAVLERVFREGVYKCPPDELKTRVDAIISDYVNGVLPPEEKGNARLHGLFRRLRRGVMEFLRSFRAEFAESLFTPVLFEVPIGIGGEDSLPPMKIPLGDGTYAVMRGVADRVDSHRDGEGTLYIRVIDYKTGQKSFDASDIERGLNLQLPLYMYTIADADDPSLASRLGGKSGDVIKPAGFLYVGVRPADEKATDGTDFDSRDADAVRKLPKSGLLLRDEAVLRAMDPALAGEYIPVKIKKDGTFYADSLKSTVTEEEFDTLYAALTDTVARISQQMRRGDADAVPTKNGSRSPCDYCAMKAVCRRK